MLKQQKGEVMERKAWTDEDTTRLIQLSKNYSNIEIAQKLGRSSPAVAAKLVQLRGQGLVSYRNVIQESPARVFDDQMVATGDMLILPDVEAPYHHADWINRCIDLAMALNVKQLCVAGDFVHFANFSQWAGNFKPEPKSIADNPEAMAFLETLSEPQKAAAIALLENMRPVDPGDGISEEMKSVRKTAKDFGGAFETIYYIMGNHEHRKIRLQGFTEGVSDLKRFFELGDNWKISPYYYMFLDGTIRSRIEHPNGASARYAIDIAIQQHQHVFMGHSHRLARQKDPSGDFWAIQMGHCVDEKRLQYVMQRTVKRDAHCLGAVLYYDGYPFLLEQESPLGLMRKMTK